jgi:hypothetical protein
MINCFSIHLERMECAFYTRYVGDSSVQYRLLIGIRDSREARERMFLVLWYRNLYLLYADVGSSSTNLSSSSCCSKNNTINEELEYLDNYDLESMTNEKLEEVLVQDFEAEAERRKQEKGGAAVVVIMTIRIHRLQLTPIKMKTFSC